MQKFKNNPIFFSLLDFKIEGGHSLRVLGIVNELAKTGMKPIIISNCSNFDVFHKNVIHISLNISFNKYEKSLMQFFTSVFPLSFLFLYYRKIIKKIFTIFKDNNIENNSVFFFENIDFCIAYLMLKKNIIKNIIIDKPGIPPLEFDYKFKNANNIMDKLLLKLKFFSSLLLENIIVKSSSKVIVASDIMMSYYEKTFPKFKTVKYFIIPYYLDSTQQKSEVDLELKDHLTEKYELYNTETVILFVGNFKRTGGVPDLIKTFIKTYQRNKNIKLLLIGAGYTYNECVSLAENSVAKENIIFEQRIPYKKLRTYQDLADIIVCPDRDNSFSRMIVHLKLWDSLLSNKIVLCSGFEPILNINRDRDLCVNFKPSNLKNFEKKLIYVLENKSKLLEKYSSNRNYVENNFTYSSIRANLLEIFNN